jgi:DNA-binding response OmpR family regulator
MTDLNAATHFPEARVLVVDDEMEVRSVLMRFLNLSGYRADEAASGDQALEMLERTPYDVVVLDIRMPDMDGVEVMRRARQVRPGVPIIFLTGYATLETAIAALRSRATDYLLKPAGICDLAAAVACALQQRTQQDLLQVPSSERFLCVGPVSLDRERRVAIVEGAGDADAFGVELTVSEAALLAHLVQHPGIVLSCRELAQVALDYNNLSEREARNIIRPHIARLRKKIESDSANPRLIRTVPSRGYILSS